MCTVEAHFTILQLKTLSLMKRAWRREKNTISIYHFFEAFSQSSKYLGAFWCPQLTCWNPPLHVYQDLNHDTLCQITFLLPASSFLLKRTMLLVVEKTQRYRLLQWDSQDLFSWQLINSCHSQGKVQFLKNTCWALKHWLLGHQEAGSKQL